MELSQLKYALEIEKTKSITGAAQNLFMGQPNLSKAMKELEQEIGFSIFKRTSKGVEVTKNGTEFLANANRIIKLMEELEQKYTPKKSETVRLNISVPRASYISLGFIDFMNEIKDTAHLSVSYRETNASTTLRGVASGEIDIGIIRMQGQFESYFTYLLNEKNIAFETMIEYYQKLVMSKENPLSDFPIVPSEFLENHTEIIYGDIQVPELSNQDIKKKSETGMSEKQIYIYGRGSQFDLLHGIKDSYMWAPPIPEIMLERLGLVQKECDKEGIFKKDFLIYSKDKTLNEYERNLIEKIRNYTKNKD